MSFLKYTFIFFNVNFCTHIAPYNFFTIASSLHETHTVVLLICFFSAKFLKQPAKVLNIDQCVIRHRSRKQLCGFLLKQYSCRAWLCYTSDSILERYFRMHRTVNTPPTCNPLKQLNLFLGSSRIYKRLSQYIFGIKSEELRSPIVQ